MKLNVLLALASILIPGSAALPVLAQSVSLVASKDADGAAYVRGLTPNMPVGVTFENALTTRNVVSNSCGGVVVRNSTTSPLPDTVVVGGQSLDVDLLPTQTLPLCSGGQWSMVNGQWSITPDRNSDGSVTTSDEFVELLVRRDNLDLSGWLLRMNDSSPDFQEPKGIYLGRGSYTLTKAGDYILILNPTGMMDDALTIQLQTPSNAVINSVTLGSGGVPNGSSTNRLNEAVARNPNGSGPWVKQQETAGMNNTDFARIRPGVE